MEIRDILVLLDGGASSDVRLEAASRMAERFDASLTGLFVALLPEIPSMVEIHIPEALKRRQIDEIRAHAKSVEGRFWDRVGSRRGSSAWQVEIGTFPDVVASVTGHARFADISIVSRSQEGWRVGLYGSGVAEEIVLSSGAPVLILPEESDIPELGKRILIGWNGSREAARAVHDSMAFLKDAEEVTLLTVESDPDQAGFGAEGGDIARHLSHHGIDASVRQSLVSGREVGDVILSRAADTSADLIVMGAYGHSRIRELALGGATRRVMARAKIPVLMSH